MPTLTIFWYFAQQVATMTKKKNTVARGLVKTFTLNVTYASKIAKGYETRATSTRIRIFFKLFKMPFTRIRVRKYTVSKMSRFV